MIDLEKWEPHPTRKNIFINQKTGLLYKRVGKHFDSIPQKMTEQQELEEFRRADGIVTMTSRYWGRVAPLSDKILSEE